MYYIGQIPPGKETNLGLFKQKKTLLIRYCVAHRITRRTQRPGWGSGKNSGSRVSPGKTPLNTDTKAYISKPPAQDPDKSTRNLPHCLSKLDRGTAAAGGWL